MEEILELKKLLLQNDIQGALAIVEELEEMSRDDIINEIESYAIVIMAHLIKQEVEGRTTNSWDASINNSVRRILRKNKRRRAGGCYLSNEELLAALEEVYVDAVQEASVEVRQGIYSSKELEEMLAKEDIFIKAFNMIVEGQN